MFRWWFTAPKSKGFSSYYVFNTVTKEFCRIRMELNRPPHGYDDGSTRVFYRPYRVIGFSARKDLDTRNLWLWHVQKTGAGERLLYQGNVLLDSEPSEREKYVYDSSNIMLSMHYGSPAIHSDKAILPPGINLLHLQKLAHTAFKRKKDIYLTSRYATPDQLASKILSEINYPLMFCDIVAKI